MAIPACEAAMQTMNVLFQTAYIFNDGHELLARLRAGDPLGEIVEDVGKRFGSNGAGEAMRELSKTWPPLHLEAVGQVVEWALEKLDTDDRVTIKWKGDADCPETVTRFELRDHELLIEFAHPPGSLSSVSLKA